MASGQIVSLCLILMSSVCGVSAMIYQLRQSRIRKHTAHGGEPADPSHRSFRLSEFAGQCEPSPTVHDDRHVAFKDSWENGVWQTRDAQASFTDRAFS